MRFRILPIAVWAALAAGAAVPLAVVTPVLSDSDGGAAVPSGFTHVPGETMYLSFQVDGYKASSTDKVHLTYKVEAFDPKGVPLLPSIDDHIDETLAPQDKNWKPTVRQEIQIPPMAGSGTYKIAISLKDEVAGVTGGKDVPFEVRGHKVEPSDTLAIRNLRFYRGEQDSQALEKPAYRAGDDLWARFDIIGYKFGDGNAIDVSYDVAVIDAGGKVLWSQADAAVDQSQSFYPKRFVPGAMSLTMQKNTRAGEYTLLVTAHDRSGKQTAEVRGNFNVE
jgi:hypothetical protein